MEKHRRRVGLSLAPVLFVALLLAPFPALSPEAHKMAAVMAFVICLWITEALPLAVTGILGPLLAIILGVAPAAKIFSSFADPIMFLFIGAFVLARAISVHELDRRFAYFVLTFRWVGESPGRILFAYGAVCCFISMWISNTATTAMMFPIGVAIIKTLHHGSGESKISEQYATGVMLICAFGASIGGLGTPVGSPPNLIGLGFIERQMGRHIPFFEWMSFAVPTVLIMFLSLFAYLNYFCNAGVKHLPGIRQSLLEEQRKLGSLTRGQRNTLIAFGITVFLWILPGIFAIALGDRHPVTAGFSKIIPESVAALIGMCLLFLLPIDFKKQEFTLNLSSALNIDWGVLAFYGGGIALGQMVFETKLAESIGTGLTGILPVAGSAAIVMASTVATLTSEFTSNAASANMVVPVIIMMTGATGGLQAIIAATMASSLGFMLPISTPTNAIVYSSGYVPLSRMIRYGILLDIIGIIVIYFCTLIFVPVR